MFFYCFNKYTLLKKFLYGLIGVFSFFITGKKLYADIPFFEATHKKSARVQTIYLLGSNHLFPFRKLPLVLRQKTANFDIFMGEIDVRENKLTYQIKKRDLRTPTEKKYFAILPAKAQKTFARYVRLPKRYTPHHLTAKCLQELLHKEALKRCIDVGMANSQKKNALHIYLDENPRCRKIRDDYLKEDSTDNIDHLVRMCALVKIVDDYPQQRREYFGFFNTAQEPEDSDQPVLKGRNLIWIPQIIKARSKYKDKTILVAVGRNHLKGKYGLLNLLRNRGYEVRQMQKSGIFKKVSHISNKETRH